MTAIKTTKISFVVPDQGHAELLKELGTDISRLQITRAFDSPRRIVLSEDLTRIVHVSELPECKSQVEYDILSSEFLHKLRGLLEDREVIYKCLTKEEREEARIRAEYAMYRLNEKFGPKEKPSKFKRFLNYLFNPSK